MKTLSQVSPSENDDTAVIAYHGASPKSPVSILIIYYIIFVCVVHHSFFIIKYFHIKVHI